MTREIRRNDDGTLDDIVVERPEFVHIEQMNDGEWWIGVYVKGNERLSIFLSSRGRIKANLAESTPLVKDEAGELQARQAGQG